jgi:hypothetical protein
MFKVIKTSPDILRHPKDVFKTFFLLRGVPDEDDQQVLTEWTMIFKKSTPFPAN